MSPLHGIYVQTYNVMDDTYTLSDGSRISRHELMMNPQYLMNQYLGSGAINGRYRQASTTAHSSSSLGAHQGNPGAQANLANLAAQQAALHAAYANAQTAITYSSTSGVAGGLGGTIIGAGGGGGGGAGGIGWINYVPLRDSPPDPVEYAGIEAGEIIAWRCWFATNDDVLHSTYMGTRWQPGVAVTGDPVNSHNGVHAWKDMQRALEYASCFGHYPTVIGSVKLWGEVIEHEKGYRAENAKIISLDRIITGDTEFLNRLRKRYGVDDNAISSNNGKGKAPAEGGQEALDDSGQHGAPLGRYARICRALFGRPHIRHRLQGGSLAG